MSMIEAKCRKCGEIFNPTEDDLLKEEDRTKHGLDPGPYFWHYSEDGPEGDGIGDLVGVWGSSAPDVNDRMAGIFVLSPEDVIEG